MIVTVMNSLVFFHLPLKVGHVPKRLVGVGADAIVGGLGIGLSGGIGDPGSGSLGSFSVLGSPSLAHVSTQGV